MPKTFDKEFLIVDGSHYLYRAYYGVPESAKLPSGLQVNAIYGFMANLRKAVKLMSPSHIYVIFDSETGIEKKVQKNDSYKANRDHSDTGMYKQLPLIQRILDYLGIKYIEPADQEADDYIGSVANYVHKCGFASTVFSNDADFLQLISNHIKVLKVGRKSLEIVDEKVFRTTFEFYTSQYVDYLSLKGDSSDNIRGVSGIGPKTSQNLIKEHGSIDNLFNNIEKIPRKARETLLKSRDLILGNLQILTINTEVLDSNLDLEAYSAKDLSALSESTNYLLSQIGIDTK
ncbi:MAG: hypothetical protein ACD_37C00012G0005 [uncultured bacterium]|nr:MAG: hypothetical protein ACD_37C00012G0005 [uncultured bacterium]